jgi:hypothetical protein
LCSAKSKSAKETRRRELSTSQQCRGKDRRRSKKKRNRRGSLLIGGWGIYFQRVGCGGEWMVGRKDDERDFFWGVR